MSERCGKKPTTKQPLGDLHRNDVMIKLEMLTMILLRSHRSFGFKRDVWICLIGPCVFRTPTGYTLYSIYVSLSLDASEFEKA